jgi:hypothetical protein
VTLFKRWPVICAAIIIFVCGLIACQEGNSMGIRASKLNVEKYFPDPVVTKFVEAVQDGNLPRVTEMIAAGMNPNIQGNNGFRPLFFVFPSATADVARALLAAGADPNARLQDLSTPLYFAVRLENSAFTQALLQAKADPNARVENDKPVVHEAVRSNQPLQLKLLAQAGVDINVVWGSGTPLYAAIGAQAWKMATMLLDLGAETNWRKSGGLNQYTAAESFCNQLMRANGPVQPTLQNRKDVIDLFVAFERRGVVLACAEQATRFR